MVALAARASALRGIGGRGLEIFNGGGIVVEFVLEGYELFDDLLVRGPCVLGAYDICCAVACGRV